MTKPEIPRQTKNLTIRRRIACAKHFKPLTYLGSWKSESHSRSRCSRTSIYCAFASFTSPSFAQHLTRASTYRSSTSYSGSHLRCICRWRVSAFSSLSTCVAFAAEWSNASLIQCPRGYHHHRFLHGTITYIVFLFWHTSLTYLQTTSAPISSPLSSHLITKPRPRCTECQCETSTPTTNLPPPDSGQTPFRKHNISIGKLAPTVRKYIS